MFAALVDLEVHIPAATSLKAKRGVVKGLAARLRQELNCSVAETDHQDLWQRATLGVAIAAAGPDGARKVAQQVEKIVWREPRVELIRVGVTVTATEE